MKKKVKGIGLSILLMLAAIGTVGVVAGTNTMIQTIKKKKTSKGEEDESGSV